MCACVQVEPKEADPASMAVEYLIAKVDMLGLREIANTLEAEVRHHFWEQE